jgi:perosamine synthetase
MKIPLGKPIFDDEMEKVAIDTLRNERFVLGESVKKFEDEFAKYCGTDYAVSTSSGTDALKIAMLAAGLKPGEAVVTSPASFIASANAIIHAQGVPNFSDIHTETNNIDPLKLEKTITEKTKAIIPVHLYGFPADMASINDLAKKRGLIVIEDACQAHGALYDGKRTGSLGVIGCFSFYPSKNMTVGGDGGMITTNDEKIAASAAKLRDCGRKSQYVHDVVGFTSRLNSVNAAIGRVQLRRLDVWNDSRRQAAKTYNRSLEGVGDLVLPPKASKEVEPVYHLYVVRTKYRDELKNWLESQGIGCGIHYVLPIHLQPIYQEMFGYKEGAYPNAEELCKTCLSIPIFPNITKNEILYISQNIHKFFDGKECRNSNWQMNRKG